MCGIAGIVTSGARSYADRVDRAMQSLAHRGPDGNGTVVFDECALGHRRLSIVDLTTGDQPMRDASGTLAVTFNGEIYGYRDLRVQLSGYPFRTTSDTEVILALYRKYGSGFVRHLPGMFAFSLWDDARKELICARDRFGEKPFYYARGDRGEFIFASEIKAILATGLVSPKIDIQSIAHYLKHLYVHPHYTIYENIHVLPPAHTLVFSRGKIAVERYWHMPKLDARISIDEAIPEFKRLFEQAVQRQLVADVPVGAFLSGGLDSSTVVAVASRFTHKLSTFSFGFRDSINELPYARGIAERYGTHHTELFDDGNLAELLVRMQGVYDEPFADSSNIPMYCMSQLARKHVTVALTGDGGDELLGGYGWYAPYLHMRERLHSPVMRTELFRFLARVARRTLPRRGTQMHHRHLGAVYGKKFSSVFEAHREASGQLFSEKDIRALGVSAQLLASAHAPSWELTGSVDDALRADIEDYMPGDILTKIDRASMAHGLELRAPFLDVDFASFCISLPYTMKISKDSDKDILRRAYADAWTPDVRTRSKQGFGAPVEHWFRTDAALLDLVRTELGDSRKKIFQILNYQTVQRFARRRNYHTWALLVLSLWMEQHEFSHD